MDVDETTVASLASTASQRWLVGGGDGRRRSALVSSLVTDRGVVEED